MKYLLISVILVLMLTSCGNTEIADISESEVTTEATTIESTTETTETTTQPNESRLSFASADEIESIPDEKLAYLAENNSYSQDYDLFGIPMEENESINTYVFQYDSADGLDINQPVPDEIMQALVDSFYENMISSNNTFDGSTGSELSNESITFCGENESYKAYRISFTESRSYYNNGELVTNEIQRNYRYLFMKNWLNINGSPVCFCPLDSETAEQLLNDGSAVYSEFSETDEAFILTAYNVHISYGDYGLCDTAYLTRTENVIDKSTHVCTAYESYVKSAEIAGTYHDYPEFSY